MGRSARITLLAVGTLILLLIIAVVSIPMFLNTDSFRTRIETTLTKSLGRKVTIGKLDLSVWSGSLVAENATVADDPAFSSQPFIQADSVKIGVQILPLLLRRQVLIRGFALQSPKIQLLRAANGTWNYSTISAASKSTAQDSDTKQTFPDLTVGKVDIDNGQITVGSGPGVTGASATPIRTYQQVTLDVENFGFTNSFPFSASAHLPAEGTVSISGKAGPINQQDASATPFSGNLVMKHIDPLAAGFVDASAGLTGLIDSLTLDASWSGQQMHIAKLLIDTPHLTLLRSNAPTPPPAAPADAEGSSMLQNLSVDDAQIKNGSLTLATAGQTTSPAVYQQLNAQITNFTPMTVSAFTLNATLPGGGTLAANGKAGPYNTQNSAATPLDAHIDLKHFELGTAGILPPDAGISGMADLQAQIQSNGQILNATGTTQVASIKLAKNGQPSAKPLQVQFNVSQDQLAKTGQIQQAVIKFGAAVINLAGTFQTSGPTTALNLKVNGNAVPINDLEAFLPALGVHLPQGSRLQGGTLTTALTVSGSTANPAISGPVRLDNTQLAGFDLGSKLQSLSQFTGGRLGGATRSGTNIRSLSMVIQEQGGAIHTDKVLLDVADVGTASGAGTVSAAGALNYNVVLKLTGLTGSSSGSNSASSAGGISGIAGALSGFIPGGSGGAAAGLGTIGNIAGAALKNGIPVAIGGTTSNPTFAPNLGKLVSGAGAGAAQGLVKGKGNQPAQSNPLGNALGGLFGKH
jgi:AsmA protein